MPVPFTRSLINHEIRQAKAVAEHFGFALPAFAFWTPDQWRAAGDDCTEIRECMLGWDVTDFGSGDFFNIGRVLFTLRNGRHGDPLYPKPYAEKLLIDPENQRAPAHYHHSKREDIICRCGGNIIVQLTKADSEGQPSGEDVVVQVSGATRRFKAGEHIRLRPGESVTIPPGTIHQFWAEEGTGYAMDGKRFSLSSEISSVCDDKNDNVFFTSWASRFPVIVEDESAQAWLCHEYPTA